MIERKNFAQHPVHKGIKSGYSNSFSQPKEALQHLFLWPLGRLSSSVWGLSLGPVLICLASAFPWIFTEAPITWDTLWTASPTAFSVLLNTWHQQFPTQIPALVSLPTAITSNPPAWPPKWDARSIHFFSPSQPYLSKSPLTQVPCFCSLWSVSVEWPGRFFLETQFKSGYSPGQDPPMAPISRRTKSKPLALTSCPSTLLFHGLPSGLLQPQDVCLRCWLA